MASSTNMTTAARGSGSGGCAGVGVGATSPLTLYMPSSSSSKFDKTITTKTKSSRTTHTSLISRDLVLNKIMDFYHKTSIPSNVSENIDAHNSTVSAIHILEYFPKVLNHETKCFVETTVRRLDMALVKVRSPLMKTKVLHDITQHFINKMLPYTGFHMMMTNVNRFVDGNENQDGYYELDKLITKEDIYDNFNQHYPLIHVLEMTPHTFLLEFVDPSQAKNISNNLNGCKMGNGVYDMKNIQPVSCQYIDTRIQTRKHIYDWKTRTTTEKYHYYHHNKDVPMSSILDYVEKARKEFTEECY